MALATGPEIWAFSCFLAFKYFQILLAFSLFLNKYHAERENGFFIQKWKIFIIQFNNSPEVVFSITRFHFPNKHMVSAFFFSLFVNGAFLFLLFFRSFININVTTNSSLSEEISAIFFFHVMYVSVIHDKLSKIVFACYRIKTSLAEENSNALH